MFKTTINNNSLVTNYIFLCLLFKSLRVLLTLELYALHLEADALVEQTELAVLDQDLVLQSRVLLTHTVDLMANSYYRDKSEGLATGFGVRVSNI